MELPAIPNDLLADIFLRLPTPEDLIHASAACVSFHRVVADRAFLRRFRKLHLPPLLGFLEEHRFHPSDPPYPSAWAASAVASAADFSFSFLPGLARDWSVQDGRVLLERPLRDSAPFVEIVVCDPLHLQYLLLPPIPDDLAASVDSPIWIETKRWGESFLVGFGGDEEAAATEETSFRVIWMAQCKTEPMAFVFCSDTGQWRAIPSVSWSDLLPGFVYSTWKTLFLWRRYAYGCFYWTTTWTEKLLVLDTRRMEFSVADRPPEVRGLYSGAVLAIVEAGEGMIGIFGHTTHDPYNLRDDTSCVNYTIGRNSGGSSTQWQMEQRLLISSTASFVGSVGRHLLLHEPGSWSPNASWFTLDVKTFELERVCASGPTPKAHAYCNFPPSMLSSPTVSSATPHADVRGAGIDVPVPEPQGADYGGVQEPVPAAAAQAPPPLLVVDNDAKAGGGEREGTDGAGYD